MCYNIKCNKNVKEIYVYINNSLIICPKNGTILYNISEYNGTIKCPDYNLICTSDIWCNELFDCIDKKSLSDLTTYDYKYNNKNKNLTNIGNDNGPYDDFRQYINHKYNNAYYFKTNKFILIIIFILISFIY